MKAFGKSAARNPEDTAGKASPGEPDDACKRLVSNEDDINAEGIACAAAGRYCGLAASIADAGADSRVTRHARRTAPHDLCLYLRMADGVTILASRAQLRAAFLRWALVLVPGIVLLGYVSGVASGSAADDPWFASLTKPAINPPPVVFPVVWTLLYILMALALVAVITAWGARGRRLAIAAFAFQLLANLAWSPLFFAGHRIGAALVLIAVLDVLVIICTALFWRVRQGAGLLLLPYLAWVLFATVLNWQFYAANPNAVEQGGSGAVVRMQIGP